MGLSALGAPSGKVDTPRVQKLTLSEVRYLLDQMQDWRLLGPPDGSDSRRYERLCDYESRLLALSCTAA